MLRSSAPSILALIVLASSSMAQTQVERLPATPLIAHDPYFSVWSDTDLLTDSPTRHWTGHPQPLEALVRVDNQAFRVMGDSRREVPAMTQTGSELTPTHTRYHFAGAGIALDLTFFTPAFLNDLDILSRPVTYLSWTAHATDGAQHTVTLFFGASAEIATSYQGQPVTFSRNQTATTSVLSVGTTAQQALNRSGDDLRIDWGYFHIAVPKDESSRSTIGVDPQASFLKDGSLSEADAMDGPVALNRFTPLLAVTLPMGPVGAAPVSRHLLLSYTDNGAAVEYMNRRLPSWWQRDGKTVSTMLDEAEHDYPSLEARGVRFDAELVADLTHSAGEHYAWLCTLAYRQSIAAHKLVADNSGQPMLFAKENFSNGDMATVDVLYPSAPLFLFFNPRLLEAQLLPVLAYAANSARWRFPFAPHDLGQYPLANGQEYGGGEKTEENQMPVEESGNLLILVDAVTRAEGNTALAERFWPQLTQWADYLYQHGFDPENQLTTDDFAGHVTHNANLSLKAIDALAAYADLCRLLHHEADAHRYGTDAHTFAQKWVEMDRENDHYKLAFNSAGTWSQKYNLVWDKLLGYNLFPKSVRETEIAYYQTKLNLYGLPLDSRADYTKNDWTLWTATLSDSNAAFDALVDPIYRWANATTSRVPLTDWYDTKTGRQVGFQARSVVGGFFIKALSDKQLVTKYNDLAKLTSKAQGREVPCNACQ